MTTREKRRAALRSKKGFFAESLRERFFTQAVWSHLNWAVANACSPSFRIQASAISARSCGLEMVGPGALCVSLTPGSLDEVFSSDLTGADCVEVRLDYLDNPRESVTTRWDRLPLPVIATCRGREWGGKFPGSIDEEVRILQYAVENGAKFIDIDHRFARSVAGARVIGSFHDFAGTPCDIDAVLERSVDIARSAGEIMKRPDDPGACDRSSKPMIDVDEFRAVFYRILKDSNFFLD